MELKKIEGQTFGQERALYASRGVWLRGCAFDGEQDGESALKESREVVVEDSFCNLRYPFWHDVDLVIRRTEMTPLCRAALWYSQKIVIEDSLLHGIKALRECADVEMRGCEIQSPEFGWFTRGLSMRDCRAEGEYFLLHASDVNLHHFTLQGKYSFQYVENLEITDSELNTKDAFWHAKHVTLRNCRVKGEYLGWYSEGLTMIDCEISGTQPFCYCKDLCLVNCKLTDADLCFEKSDVTATLTTPVVSIKNPRSGSIRLPAVGELIMDDPDARGEVILSN